MVTALQKCKICIGNDVIEILLQGGFSNPQTPLSSEMHCHPNTEIHYIEKGSCIFGSVNESTELAEGSLLIIPPVCYHSFKHMGEVKRVSFEMIFKGDNNSYKKLFEGLGTSIIKKKTFIPEFTEICSMMGMIESEEDKAKLSSLFTLSFLKICNTLRKEFGKGDAKPQSNVALILPSEEDATLVKALQFIEKNSTRGVTITALAAEIGLSARQLQRIFSSRMGKTFSEILGAYRIFHAKKLMSESEGKKYSLSEIALLSGFQSYASFWSQFKRVTGTLPSSIKRKWKLFFYFKL